MTESANVHDIDAELSLIGGALYSRAVLELVIDDVPAAAFSGPGHGVVVSAIESLTSRGEPVNPMSVRAELEAIDGDGRAPLLLSAASVAVDIGTSRRMASVVMECWARRQTLVNIAAAHTAVRDRSTPLERTAELLAAATESVDVPTMRREPSMGAEDFIAMPDKPDEWIVPGLLQHRDRALFTGTEGAGKSWTLRQMGVQIAAGMHPFTHKLIEPKRVLIIDLENSEEQVRRGLRPVMGEVKRQQYPGNFNDNLRVEVGRTDIDLLGSSADVRWFLSVIEANRPDVIVSGPLYKMGATSNKEEEASAVARVFDKVRTRWNSALLLEAHAPHGDAVGPHGRSLRPYGASLWMRWPEFGIGMKWCGEDDDKRYLLTHWRGQREKREWPKALIRTGHNIAWGVRRGDEAAVAF